MLPASRTNSIRATNLTPYLHLPRAEPMRPCEARPVGSMVDPSSLRMYKPYDVYVDISVRTCRYMCTHIRVAVSLDLLL